MAIIATWAAGHEKHGEIIDWSREQWSATRQYTDDRFAFVLCNLAEDEVPVKILNFGPVSEHDFGDGHGGSVTCSRTYQEASVETEKVKAE